MDGEHYGGGDNMMPAGGNVDINSLFLQPFDLPK